MSVKANFQVTPEELHKTSRKLESDSQNYRKIYQNLLSIASSVGDAWIGTDYDAFNTQINALSKELEDMAKKLSVASQALEEQAKNYEKMRSLNIETLGKLK